MVFGLGGVFAEAGVFLDGAGVVVGDELDQVGVGVVACVVGGEGLDEVGLEFVGDDFIALVVHGQERDGFEVGQVGLGVDVLDFGSVVVDSPWAWLGWIGWEVEPEEVACGAFDGGTEEVVLIAEVSQGDHASGGHASDGGFFHVKDLKVGDGFEDGGDFVDGLGEVVDGLGGGVAVFGEAFTVTWEVDGDGADAGAGPAVVASGVEFFVDGSAMEPEDPGAGGLLGFVEVWVDDEGGDIIAQSVSEAYVFGFGLEGFGELFEAVVGGGVLGHVSSQKWNRGRKREQGALTPALSPREREEERVGRDGLEAHPTERSQSWTVAPGSMASGRSLPMRSAGVRAVRGESSMVALTEPSSLMGILTPADLSQLAARWDWSCFEVSMESGPVAFLTGANSSTRSVSRTMERSVRAMASKTNCSSLMALGSVGSMCWPVLGSKWGTFLMALWKGRA